MLTRDSRYIANADLSMAKSGTVDADGYMDMTATELRGLMQPWLPEITHDWQLTRGQAQGAINLRWQSGRIISGAAHIKAFDVALAAGSIKAENVNMKVDIDDLTTHSLALFADAPSLTIGKAMTARNFIVKAHYLDRNLTVQQAALSIYDGFLAILPCTVNMDQRPILLTLQVRDVDLSQLLSSLHYEDLTATGTVRGELPLSISSDAVELLDGSLKGTRPGVLRYLGPVADKESIAFKALRNLEYRSLQAKVNYRPNGDYHLGLRVEGSNPDVLSGQPFAFNLNLNGQLPELLQRGMMAGDFERAILEEAKSKPTNTKKPTKLPLKPPVGVYQPKPPLVERRN